MDTVFWFGLSAIFVIFAVFPQTVIWTSQLIGFNAPVNFFSCYDFSVVYTLFLTFNPGFMVG